MLKINKDCYFTEIDEKSIILNTATDLYFELDEKEDPLYLLIQGKIATFISYWYYASAITKEDFQKLDQDIENGDV